MNDLDSANMLNAVSPINYHNVVEGGSTYGFWELIAYLDTTFSDQWLYIANDMGLGMGAGLVITATFVRTLFIPLLFYSQSTGIKMQLLQPDMNEIQDKQKQYM